MTHAYKLILAGIFFLSPIHFLSAESPAIAIIIDDIGHSLEAGKRVVNSHWTYTCSILPARPYSIELAKSAYQSGKEVIVHLPMQAAKSQKLGNGALKIDMARHEFELTVNLSIDSVPYASGVSNHMGSLLTRKKDQMDLLMRIIANRDDYLYFIDSKTTASSIAGLVASQYHIPTLTRDIFLDSTTNDKEHVRKQVRKLLEIAKNKGYALAIGHPYNETITVLDFELRKLGGQGIQLVTVSKLIEIAKSKQWQAYSSPSLKVAKNLKQ